jgi:RNA polymerase sigma-70 factor (ECF subfamily)
MSDTALSTDLQALLEQSGWVRRLARRLASGADADELEQATWLAALRFRSERKAPLREWLGAIARNLARQQKRARGRRAEHEERAARGEELPATVDLLARAELQRRLVGAVTELDEPYRTALLLRWFEYLPPREIASRLGVPVATVRTRLARGLEKLRARLDAEHGGERGLWVSALAPLWTNLAAPTSGLGALLVVNAKIVIACVFLTAAGAAAWWLSEAPEPAAHAPSEVAARPAAPEADLEVGAVEVVPGPAAERVAVRRAAPQPGSDAGEPLAVEPRAAPARRIAGRVFDAGGRGLGNARVVATGATGPGGRGEAAAVSLADGSFVIEEGPESGALASGSPELATVLGARFGADTREDVFVVLAPRLDLAGVVVDASGAPIAGAKVALAMPDDLRSRFTVVLDRALSEDRVARSGAEGAFALEGAPQVEGATLVVEADSFEPWSAPAPAFSDLGLRIALERPGAADGWVRGVVVDPAGRPVAGARVAFGIDTERTGADGGFAFRIDDPESFGRRVGLRATRLVALAQGWLPAVYEPPLVDGAPAWPARVTLALAGQTLSLSGQVVDAEGEALGGVRVYVADATLFGAVDGRVAVMETLFAPGEATWKYVESDAEGRFSIDGLLDRDYVVRAHDPETLLMADSDPVPAGRTGVEVRLPTDRLYPRVAGRVLSLGGEPIAGAEVFPMCDAFRVRHEGRPISTSHGGVEGTTTDAEGRFELRDVPMSLVYLRVNGDNILPVEYGRWVEGDARFAGSDVKELPKDRITALEIRAEARCHMQVELGAPDLADELCVLDAKGREVVVSLFEADGRQDTERHPIHEGRSAMLSVPETGRTLVLFKQGVEVARSAIRLDASEPTVVRL